MSEFEGTDDPRKAKRHLKTTRAASEMVKKFYAEQKAKQGQPGQKIAWCGIAVPKDLLQAFDIVAIYPEQYGSVVASKGDPQRFIKIAEEAGYTSELCGYARTSLGFILEGLPDDAPLGGMARPDMLIVTTGVCDTRIKWFELMSHLLDVPMHLLEFTDMPPIGREGAHLTAADMETIGIQIGRKDAPHLMAFSSGEYLDLIRFLEEQCGRKMDYKKLGEIQKNSRRVGKIRKEINEYRKEVPTPMGSADAFTAMFPGTYMPGEPSTEKFYSDLRAEIRERIEKKLGIVPEEKYRLLWSGIPFWYNMGLMNYFEKTGGVVVMDTQYSTASMEYKDNPLRMPSKWGMNGQIAAIVRCVIDYNIDGVICSYTPTCRALYVLQKELKATLEEELDTPALLLESDMVDPTSYNEGQTMTRLDAFIELVLEKASRRKWLQKG